MAAPTLMPPPKGATTMKYLSGKGNGRPKRRSKKAIILPVPPKESVRSDDVTFYTS